MVAHGPHGEVRATERGKQLEGGTPDLTNCRQMNDWIGLEALKQCVERRWSDVIQRPEDGHAPERLPIEDVRFVRPLKMSTEFGKRGRSASHNEDAVVRRPFVTQVWTQFLPARALRNRCH